MYFTIVASSKKLTTKLIKFIRLVDITATLKTHIQKWSDLPFQIIANNS